MADIVVKTNSGNETYTGIESVTFNTTQEGVKATFIAQKQADWLQNDETAVDYIKNKPFYENGDTVVKLDNKYLNILEQENVNENVILTQQNITDFAYNATFGAFWTIRYSILAELVEGQEYTVVWNGIEYVRTAFAFTNPTDGTSCIAVGNKMVSTGVDDGDRFAIVNDTTNNHTHLFSTEDKTEHSVAIYQAAAATYKINKTYLPEDIGKQSDWNQTDDTAVDFIKNKPENLATKTYVQEQIAAIDIPEAPEQVQADWNENDETSKAFVQNKPFYTKPDVYSYRTTTFSKSSNNNSYIGKRDYTQMPDGENGKTYRVFWDEVEYLCIARNVAFTNGSLKFTVDGVLGNPQLWVTDTISTSVTSSEPFAIILSSYSYSYNTWMGDIHYIATSSTNASHTIRIIEADNVVKLPEEYLPDNIGVQSDWNEIDETNKAFILNKPEIPSIEGLATEDFVKEQIAAIEIPEGGGSSGSVSTEEVFLEETEIENAFSLDGLIGAQISFTDCFNIGETYYVNWNGVEYEVTNAQDVTTLIQNLIDPTITKAIAIGNLEIFELDGNNEPFTIITTGEVIMFADLSPEAAIGGKNTVRIYQKAPLTVSWENVTDKPFGEEIATIFEGTFQDTLVDNDGDGVNDAWDGLAMLEDSSDATLVIGQTYTVTWDGVEYELVCVSYQGLPCVGSSAVTTEVPDDIPFIIVRDATGIMGDGQVWAVILISPPTDLTISGRYDVKITSGGIKHLDNKYLGILENSGEELIPETTMELTYQSSEDLNLWAGSPQTITEATYHALYSKAGEQVLVMFDGVEYLCNVLLEDGSSPMILLGNFGMFPSAPVEDTGEPFFFMIQRTGAEGSYEYVWNIGTNDPAPADTSVTIEHTVGVILNPGYKIKDEYLSILEGFEDKEIEIYPEDTWSTQLDDNFGYALARPFGEELPVFPLTIGDECTVVWDGEEYKVTVGDLSSLMPNAIFVGNGTALELPGNNEPFLIGWDSTGVTFAALTDTESTEHTVRIYQKIEGGYKIKESYIPDSMKLPVVTVEDNGKALGVVDGAWSTMNVSSGGSSLPEATTEDNNKFLRIVDGVPAWVSLTDVSTEGA